MLSTIILNWNRERLLRRTVASYLATTEGSAIELCIVDNASTDGSGAYLDELARAQPQIRVLRLPENIGGKAYNLVIGDARGDLIHLSENDQEFLPGWVDHARDAFETFPDLGQLSLHHDVPADDEAWVAKPSRLRFAKGKILYEALGNVGTSSLLRASIVRERGVRVSNHEHGAIKFPNDGALSDAVKSAGYWVAWSDRYYARNLGHLVSEFEAEPDYYRENYASKPWLGEAGWRERIEAQRRIPKPVRNSIVLSGAPALPEKTEPPVGAKPARLWSMFDGWTAEVEVLDFLYALVRLVKPALALETGTWLGWSACAIGRALQANGFGRLISLETNPEAYAVAQRRAVELGVTDSVDLRLESSLDFSPRDVVEFALLDSETTIRETEFRRFLPWLAPGATIVFHDTAVHHKVVGDGVNRLITEGLLEGVTLPTPRGIFVGTCRQRSRALPELPRLD